MNSAARERRTHEGARGATAVPLRDRRGGRDDRGIPRGIKAQRKGGPCSTREPGFSVGCGGALGGAAGDPPTRHKSAWRERRGQHQAGVARPGLLTRPPPGHWSPDGGEGTRGRSRHGPAGGLGPGPRRRTMCGRRVQLRSGPRAPAYLSPACQIQQSRAYPGNSQGFRSTQFRRTSRQTPDSERVRESVSS